MRGGGGGLGRKRRLEGRSVGRCGGSCGVVAVWYMVRAVRAEATWRLMGMETMSQGEGCEAAAFTGMDQ